jgi:hypothetical protein
MREGEAVFDELRDGWARQIGPAKLKTLEKRRSQLVGPSPVRLDDTLGWMARGLGK